jgi:glycerol-3-phosphate dehydrogenase
MNEANGMSAFERESILTQMGEAQLDLLIIGGGITGAGIAMDASKRGLRVGLVEMQDFAEGTSSRSTKLIHGGLRYLKQGEIKLVQEVGRERAIIYKNAPHVVKPAPMLLPLYKGGTYGKFASSIGLYVYDWLAGVARKERRKMLGKEETLKIEPGLNPKGLVGGGLYVEYMTDDARLTIEIMKTARQQGALLVNYAQATDFIYNGGQVVGVQVTDRISNMTKQIYATRIVNAAGPWVDTLRKKDRSMNDKRLHLTKGVHLVFAKGRFPLQNSVYFDAPDGRMIFAISRGDITYAGTTDTNYEGNLENPLALIEDRDYILSAVNATFPALQLTEQDVLSSWTGLRPLIHQEGKGPSELSRKDEVFLSPTGLITIAGGKLTGFRKMAEKVVDLVCDQLGKENGKRYPKCTTEQITISGGDGRPYTLFDKLQAERVEQGVSCGVTRDRSEYLVALYGANSSLIFDRIVSLQQNYPDDAVLRGQILYCVEEEMAVSLADFLVRRSGALYFSPIYCREIVEKAADLMAEYLNWTSAQRSAQLKRMEELMNQSTFSA